MKTEVQIIIFILIWVMGIAGFCCYLYFVMDVDFLEQHLTPAQIMERECKIKGGVPIYKEVGIKVEEYECVGCEYK